MASLRYRLIVWHASVFAIGLAGFSLVIWLGARQILNAEIERWLGTQAEGLHRFLQLELRGTGERAVAEEAREFSSGLPKGSGMQLFRAGGQLLLSVPAMAAADREQSQWTTVDGERRTRWIGRAATIAGERYRFVLWRSYEEADATLALLGKLLAGLMPVFLLLSVAGGWWLSRRTLQPVDDLTRAAREMSLNKLSDRLPLPEARDELYRLCEAWNEMLGRLEESALRLKQFTADASHELRTPVAIIRAAADLALRHEREPEAYRQALAGIKEQSVEMSALIESLLELARSEGEQIRSSFTEVDLRAVAREVEGVARPRAADLSLDFAVDCPATPAYVFGDGASLRRLLMILVDNALKFTPSPGKVEVRIAAGAEETSLVVRDTGIGIEPGAQPKVFERFFQADPSRSVAGAGLGLSLAQWIVSSHRAAIELESAPGRGSAFRVRFPLAAASTGRITSKL